MAEPVIQPDLTDNEKAIIAQLSNMSPALIFLWAGEEAGSEPEQRCFKTHIKTIMVNIAARKNVTLNPSMVPGLRRAIDSHNALVVIARDAPQSLLANEDRMDEIDQSWKETVSLTDCDIWLMELVTKVAKEAFGDSADKLQALLYVAAAWHRRRCPDVNLATVLAGRLSTYKVTLNPYDYPWTFNDIQNAVYWHDLNWLINVLDGHEPVFTATEGEEMNSRAGITSILEVE